MTCRVLVASPTYRHYCAEWVIGLLSLMRPAPDVEARFSLLGAEFTPAVARGYGGVRQLALMFEQADRWGADFVLTAEWDHDWNARHVAQVLEAEQFLRGVHGPVAVGAMYPSSNEPHRHVLKPMHPGMTRAELEDRTIAAAEVRELPESMLRYVEAFVLPAGFTLWPVAPFRDADIVERIGRTAQDYWDALASEMLIRSGVRLFVDLSLDVGHVPASALTSLEVIRRSRGLL